MMRLNFLFLLLGLNSVGFAQQLLPIQHDTNAYDQEYIINGVADFGATSIQNSLSSKFLFGPNKAWVTKSFFQVCLKKYY